jgi:hypothetical protein
MKPWIYRSIVSGLATQAISFSVGRHCWIISTCQAHSISNREKAGVQTSLLLLDNIPLSFLNASCLQCDRIWEKGALCVCICRNFVLKRLYLWNHSSYEPETWHEYSSMILQHSLRFRSPAHFGERACQSCSKVTVLCLTLAAHRSGQEAWCSF